MKRLNKKGFTLVEIMIVVAIIALLAAIAIPNLLRARIAANDALAKSTLRSISTASETFATSSLGNYPTDMAVLVNANPPYLQDDLCATGTPGFTYDCSGMSDSVYVVVATPVNIGTSGTSIYTISTGGILTEG